MATFEDIIQEVLMNLEGFNGDQDIYGTLNAGISSTASSFKVDGAVFADGSGFSTGLLEVGDELIYAQSLDRTTGVFTGCMRGWRGTTAAAWPANTLVRNNPRFPRLAVKRAINDTIRALTPRVPAIKTYEFTYKGAQVRYDLPEDVRNVIQVSWFVPGASKTWETSKRWNFDLTGGSSSATGRALDVWDALPGRKVQVVYQAEPLPLSSPSDNITASGLMDWVRDLVVMGACYRLAATIDAGRTQATTAEQGLINAKGYYGSASLSAGQSLSKYFYTLYQQRLAEAEARIQDMYPVARHYIN